MKSGLPYQKKASPLHLEAIEHLAFFDCVNLIRELRLLGLRELKTQENLKLIKQLESRIKHLGRTQSYKCMAALPAVNALVS